VVPLAPFVGQAGRMELLATSSATTLLPVCVERTWNELRALLEDLWPGDTDVLSAHDRVQLVHAVHEDGNPDVWLTWDVAALPCGGTRVSLQLDEILCSAPEPELDALLLALLSRCAPPRQD
jgi:hypothetical protein